LIFKSHYAWAHFAGADRGLGDFYARRHGLPLCCSWRPASDAVDGYLLQRFAMTTELGAYLDPLADKALIVSIYLTLGINGDIRAGSSSWWCRAIS
jgi:phosphatidylglycerophosphate synthase